ncbi:hypothetical protein NBRC116587_39510 [Pseudoteredinibacter isoporae]
MALGFMIQKSLINASPFRRKIELALPESSLANATATTRLPLFRKSASGTIAHQSPMFTGLPGKIKTGGPKQWFVPSSPKEGLPYLEFKQVE